MRGTMSSIYAGEQKNTVAVEVWGLAVRPVVFKVLYPHTVLPVLDIRRGRVKRMSKQVGTLGSPRVVSVPLPLLGSETRY